MAANLHRFGRWNKEFNLPKKELTAGGNSLHLWWNENWIGEKCPLLNSASKNTAWKFLLIYFICRLAGLDRRDCPWRSGQNRKKKRISSRLGVKILFFISFESHSLKDNYWKLFLSNADAYYVPDRPFHNFRASKSVDQQFQSTNSFSIDGFWGSFIVKGSVRYLEQFGQGWPWVAGPQKFSCS